jgi:hypothetical protein
VVVLRLQRLYRVVLVLVLVLLVLLQCQWVVLLLQCRQWAVAGCHPLQVECQEWAGLHLQVVLYQLRRWNLLMYGKF